MAQPKHILTWVRIQENIAHEGFQDRKDTKHKGKKKPRGCLFKSHSVMEVKGDGSPYN